MEKQGNFPGLIGLLSPPEESRRYSVLSRRTRFFPRPFVLFPPWLLAPDWPLYGRMELKLPAGHRGRRRRDGGVQACYKRRA